MVNWKSDYGELEDDIKCILELYDLDFVIERYYPPNSKSKSSFLKIIQKLTRFNEENFEFNVAFKIEDIENRKWLNRFLTEIYSEIDRPSKSFSKGRVIKNFKKSNEILNRIKFLTGYTIKSFWMRGGRLFINFSAL